MKTANKEKTEQPTRTIHMKPLVTEKAVMLIEANNILTFKVGGNITKYEVKKEVEEVFNVKVDKIRALNRKNSKHVYVKLKKEFPAIDVATKLGMI